MRLGRLDLPSSEGFRARGLYLELQPRNWGVQWGSNPHPSDPQSDAPPIELWTPSKKEKQKRKAGDRKRSEKRLRMVPPLRVERSPLALQASARTGYARAGCLGGAGRDRTADTRIFSPMLYRLSYSPGSGLLECKEIGLLGWSRFGGWDPPMRWRGSWVATPAGFEPAFSAVTGRRIWPAMLWRQCWWGRRDSNPGPAG